MHVLVQCTILYSINCTLYSVQYTIIPTLYNRHNLTTSKLDIQCYLSVLLPCMHITHVMYSSYSITYNPCILAMLPDQELYWDKVHLYQPRSYIPIQFKFNPCALLLIQ